MIADPLTKLCLSSVGAAFIHAAVDDEPFLYWTLQAVLPEGVLVLLESLEARLAEQDQTQGTNRPGCPSRRYLSDDRLVADAACSAVAATFRSPTITTLIELVTKVDLAGCRLRIDVRQRGAQTLLAPADELGPSRFTLLLCLRGSGRDPRCATPAPRPDHEVSFWPNLGIAFAARDRGGHQIELRAHGCGERFLVVDYVEATGRAPDPLALPDFIVSRRTYG